MENINLFFLTWGAIGGVGTLFGFLRLQKSTWDLGIVISGSFSLLYSIFTIASALGILMIPIPQWWAWTFAPVGFVILILSQALNIWATRTLKKNFSPKLNPVKGGTLVTVGPFEICRHPIMLGMLMGWLGTAIALGSVSLIIMFGFISVLIMKRVTLEESTLEKTYGQEFQNYKQKVSAIVPCLNPHSQDGQELEKAVDLFESSKLKDLDACNRKYL